jgi:predicted transcriptional regulator
MARIFGKDLSRRERQIMDVIYQRGQATAGDVLEGLPDPPSYSAVRALLRVLETKGHVRHKQEGNRYIYLPTQARSRAARRSCRRSSAAASSRRSRLCCRMRTPNFPTTSCLAWPS